MTLVNIEAHPLAEDGCINAPRDAGMRKKWLISTIVLLALVAGGGFYGWQKRETPIRYTTRPAQTGDVVRSIVATGTVNPVVTVEVGSYVSGRIQSIACDFNTVVKANQVCAKIDPRPYQMEVDAAKANLATARAQLKKDQASLAYVQANYQRDLGLLKRGVVSQDVVDADRSNYQQGLAQIQVDQAVIGQRQAALDAAQVNLDYTNIVSPADGVVVSRNVNVGQTVAASFQTPTLFLIAQDLTKMQVDTNVSETDIGAAKVGQKATFTVEAYPNRRFEGEVGQIRQAPITVQNVVTYNVVINVGNPQQLLLPGMTANVRIIIQEARNVLKVPDEAFRFNPGGGLAGTTDTQPRLWILKDGQPVSVDVKTGLDDGTWTQVMAGPVQNGTPVIVGESGPAAASGNSSPRRMPLRF